MNDNIRIENQDFEYSKNSNVGCYIIHGFSSSTYETKELAAFLGEKDIHTITRNLPGHGTSPEECNRVKYEDWLSFIEQDLAVLSNKSAKIIVIGMSMGGVLALHLASLFPVECVISAAAVFRFKDHKKLKYLNSFLCHFFPLWPKIKSYPKSINKKLIFHGYNQYPMIALNEFRKMTYIVKNELNKITCPLLILHANKDMSCGSFNINIIKKNVKSEIKEVKYYSNASHNIFIKSKDQKVIFHDIYSFIKKYVL